MPQLSVQGNRGAEDYADEVFLRVKNWMEARNKPHASINVKKFYSKYEWWIDQLNCSILPLFATAAISLYLSGRVSQSMQLTIMPVLFGIFIVLQTIGRRLNRSMAEWAEKAGTLSLFAITNGDQDAITKNAALAQNGVIKLVTTASLSFILNVAAGLFCWFLGFS